MNWLDWCLVVIVALGFIRGWSSGLARQLIGFAGTIVGLFAAFKYCDTVAGLIGVMVAPAAAAGSGGIVSGPTALVVRVGSMILIFVAVMVVASIVQTVFRRTIETLHLTPVDGFLGALFGAVKAVVFACLAVVVLTCMPWGFLAEAIEGSALAGNLMFVASILWGLVTKHAPGFLFGRSWL